MTKDSSAKRKTGKRKPEKLSFTQDFIPIKNLEHGIIETTDGRYIKILEIEPINLCCVRRKNSMRSSAPLQAG